MEHPCKNPCSAKRPAIGRLIAPILCAAPSFEQGQSPASSSRESALHVDPANHKVVVTGASGFIGSHLLHYLAVKGFPVRPAVRRGSMSKVSPAYEPFCIDGLSPEQDWSEIVAGQDVVVHVAGRVHMLGDAAVDPLAEFRLVNTEGTLALARQAAAAGVRRFVFISTVKVNGEETDRERPYRADDHPLPLDPYGISKLEAEQGLQAIGSESGMEIVVIRPVLVYGPGVKANFLTMMKWLDKGVPLPLGAIHNRRSFVALDNLLDLITVCLSHPAAANQTFLASDGEDLSTTQLLRRLGQAMGKPARLIPVPMSWLECGAALIGKKAVAQRLCGSLCVDIAHTCETLGWKPPVSVDEGLRRTVVEYRRSC